MNKVKVLSVLLLIWTLVDNSFAGDIPTIKVPYECHSEVNVLTDSLTMLVDEWTHESGNYYHIENRKAYETDHYYLNYPDNELYTVQNEKCKTTKIEGKDKFLDNYFLSILQNETFVSVAALLEYAPSKLTMTQITGKTTIRGVNSECWEGNHQDLKVKICWSDAWNKVQDQNSAPVFLGVTGTNKNTKGETVTVNIEAHILFFIEGVSSDSMELFQTPAELFCSDRKFTNKLPTLPDVISFYQESVVENPSVNGIANNRVTFDRNLNIVKFEYQDEIPKAPFYAWGTIIVIYDYTSGVAYYQDSLLGNCTVRPIQSNDENKEVKNGSANYFELKNPNEVFRLDGTYSFVGEKILRGIPAEYYISKRTDFKFPFLAGMNTTFSFFFLPSYLTSTTVGDSVGINSQVPLQMIIKTHTDTPEDEMGTYKQTFNFFNFAETKNSDGQAMIGETPGWEYDIRSCYESKDEKEVRIVFGTSELGKDLVKETRLFPRLVMSKIVQLFTKGRLGPLRLQHPEVDYNQTTVFVTFTIMPKPDLSKINASFVSAFADEASVDEVVKTIRDSVEKGGLVIDMQLSNGGNVSYFGLEFNDDLFRVKDELFPIIGRHLAQFTRIDNKEIEGTRQLFGRYPAEDCALQCLEDGSAQGCASFTYHYKFGLCYLSSYDPSKNPDKVTEASDAYLFTKNAMARYEKSGDVKRGSSGGDVVKTLTECATKCNEKCTTSDCKCRSFDYCKRQKKATNGADIGELEEVCFLATSHTSDSNPTNTDTIDCQHYSRGYSADFQKKFESSKVTLEPYSVQYNLNEDNCAKTCIESLGGTCKGYYFCPSTSEKNPSACAPVKATQNEQEKENGNNKCVYYSRTSSTDGSPYKPPTSDGSTAAPSTKTVSPGLTAGLVILFFVLGMVIMFIVLQFVMKKSSGRADDSPSIYYNPNHKE